MRLAARDRTDAAIAKPEPPLFASTNLAANFRECLARLHMDKTDFEREIGFGGFEHLAAGTAATRSPARFSRFQMTAAPVAAGRVRRQPI